MFTTSVLQGSIQDPLLFLVFVNDLLKLPEVQLSLFVDDTAGFTANSNVIFVAHMLQHQLNTTLESYSKQ